MTRIEKALYTSAALLCAAHAAIADTPVGSQATDDAIHTFRIHVQDQALVELRQRVQATRWPDKETVEDPSQGAQLAKMQALVHYWGTAYDWRKVESELNNIPQFVTKIDGVDIHFIHVRSRHKNALPVIISHGWPGSVIEQLKIIGPLTDPTAHGGRAEDAFDVVIPSLPGYGFSGKPTDTGWDGSRAPRAAVRISHPATGRFLGDSDLFVEGVRKPEAQSQIKAAFKRGFQTRDAEMDIGRWLGELAHR